MTVADDLRAARATEIAALIAELAYAIAKFVATDDTYWRDQRDYIIGELVKAISAKRGTP